MNDAPVANTADVNVKEDESVSFDLGADDVDDDALKFSVIRAPKSANIIALSADGKKVKLTPQANFHGEDEFVYIADDGKLKSNEHRSHGQPFNRSAARVEA